MLCGVFCFIRGGGLGILGGFFGGLFGSRLFGGLFFWVFGGMVSGVLGGVVEDGCWVIEGIVSKKYLVIKVVMDWCIMMFFDVLE